VFEFFYGDFFRAKDSSEFEESNGFLFAFANKILAYNIRVM
jgi:hypothetical protein